MTTPKRVKNVSARPPHLTSASCYPDFWPSGPQSSLFIPKPHVPLVPNRLLVNSFSKYRVYQTVTDEQTDRWTNGRANWQVENITPPASLDWWSMKLIRSRMLCDCHYRSLYIPVCTTQGRGGTTGIASMDMTIELFRVIWPSVSLAISLFDNALYTHTTPFVVQSHYTRDPWRCHWLNLQSIHAEPRQQ